MSEVPVTNATTNPAPATKHGSMAKINAMIYGTKTEAEVKEAGVALVQANEISNQLIGNGNAANQTISQTAPITTQIINKEAATQQVAENADVSKTPKGIPSDTPAEDNKSKETPVQLASTPTDGTQETEHANTSETTEAPKTIRISGKDYTEAQLVEAHESGLRRDSYTEKMQALSKQEDANKVRLNEAGLIIDRDSVSKPFADMITSNTEALTEMKEMLESKFGQKGIKVFNDMVQFDSKTFRHPLLDDLDKERAINKQSKADKGYDDELRTISAEKNLTIKGSKQLDDFRVAEYMETGNHISFVQALEIATSRNIPIESTTTTTPVIEVLQNGEVTQTLAGVTAAAEANEAVANPATSPSLLTNTSTSPAATGKSGYKKGVMGDAEFMKANNISPDW